MRLRCAGRHAAQEPAALCSSGRVRRRRRGRAWEAARARGALGGGKGPSSAVLFDRETVPSFNMTPSLLRRGEGRDDGERAAGGYNYENRKLLPHTKRIVLLRHGQSNWNEEGRIQGDTNESDLTPQGIMHAERCARALSPIDFDVCFHSPLTRAAHTAEIIWSWGADDLPARSYSIGGGEGMVATTAGAPRGPRDPSRLVEIDELKEAHLYDLQGMTNVDAARMFPEEFERWRNDPGSLCMKGHFPVIELYVKARQAWERIITDERYADILIISHKSMIRALLSTSLGLTPTSFRSFNVQNGGICVVRVNSNGEAMIESSNQIAHMYQNDVLYSL